MWYWLPKKRHKKIFLCELAALSVGAHVLFLCLVFALYQGQQGTIKLQVHAQGRTLCRPVLFLPAKRVSGIGTSAVKGGSRVGARASGALPANQVPERKLTERVARDHWASATVGAAPKHQGDTSARTKKQRVEKKKAARAQKSALRKKAERKKSEKVVPKPAQTPKVPAQVVPEPEKKQPEKVEPAVVQQPPVPMPAAQEANESAFVGQAEGAVAAEGLDAAVLVTPGADMNLESVIMQEDIQAEMDTHWHPPIGLAKDLQCQLRVTMSGDGTVERLAVEQSSGVLAYDMSARAAAMRMHLPRWAWGKELVLNFQQ